MAKNPMKSVQRILGDVASDPGIATTLDVGSFITRGPDWVPTTPWWNRRASRFVARHLSPGARAFEWGGGGSTIWLTRQGASVTTIESDPAWVERVASQAPGVDIRLVRSADDGVLRSEPWTRDDGAHFFDEYVASIDSFDDETFDLIIIDGFCREACARQARTKVRHGGLVVIDDTHFPAVAPALAVFDDWPTTRLRGFKERFFLAETSVAIRP